MRLDRRLPSVGPPQWPPAPESTRMSFAPVLKRKPITEPRMCSGSPRSLRTSDCTSPGCACRSFPSISPPPSKRAVTSKAPTITRKYPGDAFFCIGASASADTAMLTANRAAIHFLAELLFGTQLPQCAEPVFEVVGLCDLAVADRLDVDRQDAEALARVGHAEQVAGGSAGDLAAHDHPVPGHQYFL